MLFTSYKRFISWFVPLDVTFAGVLLLVAAISKWFSPAYGLNAPEILLGEVAGGILPRSLWLASELILGISFLIASKPWLRTCRFVSLATFGVFMGVHAFAWYRGISCGCFGSLIRSDSVVLIANVSVISSNLFAILMCSEATAEVLPTWSRLSIGGAIACFAIASGQLNRTFLDREELVPILDGAAILEPGSWMGKRFPLLPYVENPGSRSWEEERTVFIVSRGCVRCEMLVEHLRSEMPRKGVVLWIARGPDSTPPEPGESILPSNLRWAARTPVAIHLLAGRVTSVQYP